jgi:hypothetical protein
MARGKLYLEREGIPHKLQNLGVRELAENLSSENKNCSHRSAFQVHYFTVLARSILFLFVYTSSFVVKSPNIAS